MQRLISGLGSCAVLFFVLFSTSGCLLYGQRCLKVDVQCDGEVVLHGDFAVSEFLNGAEILRALEGERLEEKAQLPRYVLDKKQAHLQGNIVITVSHVDRVMARVTLHELRLNPDPGGPNRWSLSAPEAERVSRKAGS